jgi:hypothetical protein
VLDREWTRYGIDGRIATIFVLGNSIDLESWVTVCGEVSYESLDDISV